MRFWEFEIDFNDSILERVSMTDKSSLKSLQKRGLVIIAEDSWLSHP